MSGILDAMPRLRPIAAAVREFAVASKAAYAETVSTYVTGAVRTRAGRIGLGLMVLAIALSTGFRILGMAFMEDQPMTRVATVWGASLWLFGFGYSAALILRPALQRESAPRDRDR
jgi:hypothetical protein